MRNRLLTILFILLAGVVSAAAQRDYCFKTDGLKAKQTISFTVTKNKINGTFVTEGIEDGSASETLEFTGTKKGNVLTIKFPGKVPYDPPPGVRAIIWTLGRSTMKVPMHEKTARSTRSIYMAVFNQCKEI